MLKPICHPLLEHGRRGGRKGIADAGIENSPKSRRCTDQEQIRDEMLANFSRKCRFFADFASYTWKHGNSQTLWTSEALNVSRFGISKIPDLRLPKILDKRPYLSRP